MTCDIVITWMSKPVGMKRSTLSSVPTQVRFEFDFAFAGVYRALPMLPPSAVRHFIAGSLSFFCFGWLRMVDKVNALAGLPVWWTASLIFGSDAEGLRPTRCFNGARNKRARCLVPCHVCRGSTHAEDRLVRRRALLMSPSSSKLGASPRAAGSCSEPRGSHDTM